MSAAPSSLARVSAIAEVTWGTTPATPAMKIFRRTGGSMNVRKTTAVSEEVIDDRNVREEFQLGQDPEANYDFELTYGLLDDYLESALQAAWATNVLKIGTTRKYFTIEERTNVNGTLLYKRARGMDVDSVSLNFRARQKASGSISFKGKDVALDTAIIASETYVAAGTGSVMTGLDVASLAVHGITPITVNGVTLNINNNLRVRDQIGSLYTDELGTGMCDITGEISAYFTSNALMTEVLSHLNGNLSFTVGSTTLNKYTITIPKARFLNGVRNLGGRNDDIMLSIPFRGEYDSGSASSITITRAVV